MWARRASAILAIVYGICVALTTLLAASLRAKFGHGGFVWTDAIAAFNAIALLVGGVMALIGQPKYLTAAWVLAILLSFWHVIVAQHPPLPPSLLHGTPQQVASFRQATESAFHFALEVAIVMLTASLIGFGLAIYSEMRRVPADVT